MFVTRIKTSAYTTKNIYSFSKPKQVRLYLKEERSLCTYIAEPYIKQDYNIRSVSLFDDGGELNRIDFCVFDSYAQSDLNIPFDNIVSISVYDESSVPYGFSTGDFYDFIINFYPELIMKWLSDLSDIENIEKKLDSIFWYFYKVKKYDDYDLPMIREIIERYKDK